MFHLIPSGKVDSSSIDFSEYWKETFMLWHACSEGLVFDRDEGVAVFYDSASGNTHLIDDFALKILRI